jgi:hypothetical protein
MVKRPKFDKQIERPDAEKTEGTPGDVMRGSRRDRDSAATRWQREGLAFLLEASELAAQQVLDGVRPGDMLNLCSGLVNLCLVFPGEDKKARVNELAQAFNQPGYLAGFLEELRGWLAHIADNRRFLVSLLPHTSLELDPVALKAGRHPFAILHSSAALIREDWVIQYVRRGVLMVLTLSEEAAMVQRCKREACQCIYLANRSGQEYCSRKCLNAVAFEHFKEKQIEEIGEEAYRAQHAKVVRQSKQTRQGKQAPRESSRSLKAAPRVSLALRAHGTLGDIVDDSELELQRLCNDISAPLECPTSSNKAGVRSA